MAKCKFCDKENYIKLKSPNMYLCKEYFVEYFENRVKKSIEKYKMLNKDEKILVAVSGGKDGHAAAWVLKKLGYNIELFHINLGIKDFSEISLETVKKLAEKLEVPLHVVNLKDITGKTMEDVRGKKCSICGTTKRYLMNKFGYENGFDVIVTGHNLDDEVSFILNNILNWNIRYLAKHEPVLPAHDKFLKKVKIFFEIEEELILKYAEAEGIPFTTAKCRFAEKAITLKHRAYFNELEKERPNIKYQFLSGYMKNRHLFKVEDENFQFRECEVCGMTSAGRICSFCRVWKLYKKKK
ncbi:tRNA-5-methyluridine(54) 2-sulfurtransferase [Methanocaldococcus fervens]|uniref:PP-loop domain protein n=1 Tax=Methanocaldococcus fervens (strain DSM 4213 / JCM 15782 / AG86) TaxID=573064 RepID=C7P587_METFA|nr:ATP-binding protein [Methanocaldococcus fervens]ACV25265.1 PP-loop domain protein [Methanocaldococcus fervens AG86]